MHNNKINIIWLNNQASIAESPGWQWQWREVTSPALLKVGTATGLLLESRLTRPLHSTKENGCSGKGDTELWLTEQDLLGLNKYPHLECRAQNLLVEKD